MLLGHLFVLEQFIGGLSGCRMCMNHLRRTMAADGRAYYSKHRHLHNTSGSHRQTHHLYLITMSQAPVLHPPVTGAARNGQQSAQYLLTSRSPPAPRTACLNSNFSLLVLADQMVFPSSTSVWGNPGCEMLRGVLGIVNSNMRKEPTQRYFFKKLPRRVLHLTGFRALMLMFLAFSSGESSFWTWRDRMEPPHHRWFGRCGRQK